MKLSIVAVALHAVAVAAAVDAAADQEAAMAQLRGAAVASDSPEDKPIWDGVPDFLEQQPSYCTTDRYDDCTCYKSSNDCKPKCCTKNKGSCPNNHIPGCDNPNCGNNCQPPNWSGGGNDRDDRCFKNSDCDSGDFCKFNLANCGEQGEGRCEEIPEEMACPRHIQEVCGCNGRTYDNECVAEASGASIKHFDPCDSVDCWENRDCSSSEYCLFDQGHCGQSNKAGLCVDVPNNSACPFNFQPVCGCNDWTYDNPCMAAQAGQSIKFWGEC